MIDLKNAYEIRNSLNNKVIDKIQDNLGNIIYEAWKDLIINGIPPLTLLKSKGVDLIDYKVYGNSLQNGIPTPDTPIEVESVGEKTNNLIDYTTVINSSNTEVTLIENGFNVKGLYAGAIMNIKVKRNTDYYLQYLTEHIIGDKKVIKIYPNDTTKIAITTFHNGIGGIFNSGEYEQIQIWFYAGINTQGEVNFTNIQLEEGTVATDYEPYGYKIPVISKNEISGEAITTNIYLDEPLRKIGNYADYIDFENKKVVRNVNRVKLTSKFTWGYMSTKPAFYTSANNTPNCFEGNKMSTHFKQKALWGLDNTDTTTTGIFSNTSEIWLRFPKYTTVQTFEEWLDAQDTAGTPVYVDYAMKTPTEETIELPNIPTHKGTSVIEVDTSIMPSNMELKYIGKK